MSADGHEPHEIIIVRHRGDHDHDEHHGGVWKIAYADFMTAMMAFFLVMWLVNAANQETKSAVASYFNPVKLVDRKSSAKGVQDLNSPPGSGASSTQISKEKRPGDKGAQAEKRPEEQERQLFDRPYAVLAEIAGDAGTKQNISDAGKGGAERAGAATGSRKGDAYRDPFDPNFWSSNVERQLFPLPENIPAAAASDAEGKNAAATPLSHTAGQSDQKPGQKAADANVVDSAAADSGNGAKNDGAAKPDDLNTLSREIARLNARDHSGNAPAPDISAVRADGGILISVTDNLDYGMFPIGSARPDKRLVVALASIAKLLQTRKGEVIVSGHTDARPFTSDTYDNWRLSSARAQMAYYMLVRGGLDSARVLRVEGYADHRPRNPNDPNAAENRRIEIFLKTPG